MFRRVFVQIAIWLMLSTVALLLLVGSLVYFELRRQLQTSGQERLKSEILEVQDALPSAVDSGKSSPDLRFSDDTGQNVYFAVIGNGNVELNSTVQPVPESLLIGLKPAHFIVFRYGGRPYRLLAKPWTYQHRNYLLLVYSQISDEVEVTERVLKLMFAVGAIGILLSIGSNLVLAGRALRPARTTWQAHQTMMAELSHELQTPLATIGAIAASRVTDPNTRNDIKQEVDRASNMVKDILFLSRLRASIPQQLDEPVAVSDLTEEVALSLAPLAKKRSITLEGEAEPALYVLTTHEKWWRLISTVMKNVVDHAAFGSASHWRLRAEGNLIHFVVKNERSRSESSNTPETRGLGLSIASHLVEEMGGRFETVVTDSSVTTTFTVPLLRI